MSIVHKFPASKLPAELRGDIPVDALVTVVVENESNPIPGYTQAELEAIIAESIEQKKQGLGTKLSSRKEIDAHFDALKAQVDAKYKSA
ncbi:MAG: hypothetical protein JKY25_07285 [Robiginitomaculum sp.]|nr:hypothetical protein [Robiginitomaculum sp.]